ncbi:vacuolar protein sorting-associated protein 4B-like [Histomonas meleagridis]|uniref:vacuolar protein sorting-associated protein 4B-like n=1 Tax=Histomonas meleagridis TaxID=135588 RepID=UPI00355A8855|nr:vacuolar protein sorting-associated protein 4B-like [Histomonas meleagridis]KAH0798734.1 vacuolar protein sorting-associated protein 4B-like [Histomonas meleagridis]
MTDFDPNSNETIKAIFAFSRTQKPCLLCFEEIDNLLNENENVQKMKQELIEQLCVDNKNMIIIGTTNVPWKLDVNLIKLFSKKIFFSLPKENIRLQIVQKDLSKENIILSNHELEEISKNTELFSFSDLLVLIKSIQMQPIFRVQEAKYFKKVTGDKWEICNQDEEGSVEMTFDKLSLESIVMPKVGISDVKSALEKVRASLNEDEAKRFEQWLK